MAAPIKDGKLSEITKILGEHEHFILTTYSGLTVDALTELRNEVREKEGRVKVVKNRLFIRALAGDERFGEALDGLKEQLKGPVAAVFASEQMPAVAKVLVEKNKANQKIQLKGGFFDGQLLDESGVKQIANLPTKEELLTIIGRGLNTPAQKIATGINEIMASLARGINAVAEKNQNG